MKFSIKISSVNMNKGNNMSNAKHLKNLRFIHFPLHIDYNDTDFIGQNGQNYSIKKSIYIYERTFLRFIIIVNRNKR